jgi:hypothetical protein
MTDNPIGDSQFPLKLVLHEQPGVFPGVSVNFDFNTATEPHTPVLVCTAMNLGRTPEQVVALLRDTAEAIEQGDAIRRLAEAAGHEYEGFSRLEDDITEEEAMERKRVSDNGALQSVHMDTEKTEAVLPPTHRPWDEKSVPTRGQMIADQRAPLSLDEISDRVAPKKHVPFNPKPVR